LHTLEKEDKCAKLLLRACEVKRLSGNLDEDRIVYYKADLKLKAVEGVEFSG